MLVLLSLNDASVALLRRPIASPKLSGTWYSAAECTKIYQIQEARESAYIAEFDLRPHWCKTVVICNYLHVGALFPDCSCGVTFSSGHVPQPFTLTTKSILPIKRQVWIPACSARIKQRRLVSHRQAPHQLVNRLIKYPNTTARCSISTSSAHLHGLARSHRSQAFAVVEIKHIKKLKTLNKKWAMRKNSNLVDCKLGLVYCRRLRHLITGRTAAYMPSQCADVFASWP